MTISWRFKVAALAVTSALLFSVAYTADAARPNGVNRQKSSHGIGRANGSLGTGRAEGSLGTGRIRGSLGTGRLNGSLGT
jgi:hypothetical protein